MTFGVSATVIISLELYSAFLDRKMTKLLRGIGSHFFISQSQPLIKHFFSRVQCSHPAPVRHPWHSRLLGIRIRGKLQGQGHRRGRHGVIDLDVISLITSFKSFDVRFSFPTPRVPPPELFLSVAVDALIIAIVGYVVTYSLGKTTLTPLLLKLNLMG